MERISKQRVGQIARNRRDVKSRTMNRFTVFDEDIGSQYDFDDDDSSVPVRQDYEGSSRGRVERKMQAHRDNQLLRTQVKGSSSNANREFVHLITVRNCIKHGKEYVLKILSESVDNFRPIAPRVNQTHLEFYLSSYEDAEAVKAMSRRITDKKTGRLTIFMTRTTAPWETLKPHVKILIESVVKKRYSNLSNSLDLGDFANDKDFLTAGVHCALFNNAVVVYVCNVIFRLFSSIQGLSLKGNRLRSLDFISSMVFSSPNVIELDLSSNALTRIDELDRIRGWRIEKLHLENNECVSRFDADSYASTIHDYFPRVNYLDGVFVTQNPFKVNAVEDNDGFIHPYKLSFTPDPNVREHVERFMVEYLNFYDGLEGESTRKTLMNAYDDSAVFTFAVHRLRDSYNLKFNAFVPRGDEEAFSTYIRSSHNIVHESKWGNYRDKIVYKGAMDIAVALSKLPLTVHIKESFIMDFNIVTNDFVVFTLQGILRDGEDAFKPEGDCKYFVRNFVVVPKPDNKMAIVSDMLSLTPISNDRIQRYVDLLKKGAKTEATPPQQLPGPSSSILMTPSSLGVDSVANTSQLFGQMGNINNISNNSGMGANLAPPSTPQPTNGIQTDASGYDINDPAIQQAMIQQFSFISKMKLEWSEKCLRDSQWNFEAAGQVFNDLHSRNQIPPEAFL